MNYTLQNLIKWQFGNFFWLVIAHQPISWATYLACGSIF